MKQKISALTRIITHAGTFHADEIAAEDWSVRGPGNKLMRAVPAKNGIPYGIRPSYWNERHIMPCLLPR